MKSNRGQAILVILTQLTTLWGYVQKRPANSMMFAPAPDGHGLPRLSKHLGRWEPTVMPPIQVIAAGDHGWKVVCCQCLGGSNS